MADQLLLPGLALPREPTPAELARRALFRTLTELLHAAPATPRERRVWSWAVNELLGAGIGPRELAAVAHEYRRTWPGATLTPAALVKHVGLFLAPARRRSQPPPAPCPECDTGGGRHVAGCSFAAPPPLTPPPPPPSEPPPPPEGVCPKCETGGGYHVVDCPAVRPTPSLASPQHDDQPPSRAQALVAVLALRDRYRRTT